MSRDASIRFTTHGMAKVSVAQTTRALESGGWSLTQPAGVPYAVQTPDGRLSWTSAQATDRERVIATLDDPGRQHQWVGTLMRHAAAGTRGTFLFHPGREEITFSPGDDGRVRLGTTELTDLSWYLDAMLPSLHAEGLLGYTMRDVAR